jgi:hypothetical protein
MLLKDMGMNIPPIFAETKAIKTSLWLLHFALPTSWERPCIGLNSDKPAENKQLAFIADEGSNSF